MKCLQMVLACLLLVTAAQAATLVENGQPRAVIVLPGEPKPLEQRAAEELVEHIELISGAKLTVVVGEQPPAGLVPIRLGAAADAAVDAAIRQQKDDPSAFALVVDGTGVAIRGLSDQGTLFGAYELLEQLGVRWYMPGELGRVIPNLTSVQLRQQRTIHEPSFDFRQLQHIVGGNWPVRMRLGGIARPTGSHGIAPLAGNRALFASNPEYYPLVNGERRMRQVCVSHPEVLNLAVENIRRQFARNANLKYVGMGPDDGGGYCQCENCLALDQGVFDPINNRISMTDRYIWFFNQILERTEQEIPDLHIVWYVYAYHIMPPKIQPNPRIVGVFAPIQYDRIRSMDNPMGTDRHMLRWLVQEWTKTNPNEMYYRGYYNNLACAAFPFSQIDRIRNDTPALRQMGINVMRVECINTSWAVHTPSLYLAARMMWDVDTDVDAVLDEFYQKFYGPASRAMKQYHEALESAFRDTPYMTGSSYLYLPIFLHHPRRDAMRAMLDEAGSALPGDDSIYAQRLRAVRMGWDRMDLFLDIIAARNKHDYAAANKSMLAFRQLSEQMIGHVLESEGRSTYRLLNGSEAADNARGYFNRFFARPIEQGYQRTVEQGRLVAAMDDQWQFLIDPVEIGDIAGYPRPGELGGNWQPILTSTRSWSDQGLHYYKGVAWYRQKVTIPAEFQGKPIYLWFGGVDQLAHVWINGQFVGTSRAPEEGLPGVPGSFRPFDMPATRAVKFGEENWVVVKIENRTLSEVGTGGIVAPVMFWTPNDPAWRP